MSIFRLYGGSEQGGWPLPATRPGSWRTSEVGSESSLHGDSLGSTARGKSSTTGIRQPTLDKTTARRPQRRKLPEPDSSEDEDALQSSIYDATATLGVDVEENRGDIIHDTGTETAKARDGSSRIIDHSDVEPIFPFDTPEFFTPQSSVLSSPEDIRSSYHNPGNHEDGWNGSTRELKSSIGPSKNDDQSTLVDPVIDFEYASPKKPSWEPPKPIDTTPRYNVQNIFHENLGTYRLTTSSAIASYFLTRERMVSRASPPAFRPFPSQYMTHNSHPYHLAGSDESNSLLPNSSVVSPSSQDDGNTTRWSRRRRGRYRRYFEPIPGISAELDSSDEDSFMADDSDGDISGFSELYNFLCCVPSSNR